MLPVHPIAIDLHMVSVVGLGFAATTIVVAQFLVIRLHKHESKLPKNHQINNQLKLISITIRSTLTLTNFRILPIHIRPRSCAATPASETAGSNPRSRTLRKFYKLKSCFKSLHNGEAMMRVRDSDKVTSLSQ